MRRISKHGIECARNSEVYIKRQVIMPYILEQIGSWVILIFTLDVENDLWLEDINRNLYYLLNKIRQNLGQQGY